MGSFSFDLCARMIPKTVVTDFGNRWGQCQGGMLLYLVKLLYVILHFQFGWGQLHMTTCLWHMSHLLCALFDFFQYLPGCCDWHFDLGISALQLGSGGL